MDNKKLIEAETELEEYNGEDRIITAYDYLKETKDEPDNEVFLMSGFPTLDASIDYFEGGELTTISGLTGQGKTLFSQSLTYNFAKKKKLSCWFSFEVQPKQLFQKFGDELPNFTLPRRLQDKSLSWLNKKIWEAKVKYDIQAVFIDHLHFIVDMASKHNMSLEIGSVMRSLKKMAMFHNIAIFIIAHTGKTRLSKDKNDLDIDDIRDSSFIAQEADNVLLIWRTNNQNEAMLKIAKDRKNGTFSKIIPLVKGEIFLREKEFDER